jgi:hypothetical protein
MINDSSRFAAEVASRALSLASRAEALADEIDALYRDIRSARYEPIRRAGFRCDTAIGHVRQASAELQGTADQLESMAAATKPGVCRVSWGVCPEHGNTLTSSGGKAWCRNTRCGRTWGSDRVGVPCIEPVRWRVTDKHGGTLLTCDGHALDASERIEGAQVELQGEFA